MTSKNGSIFRVVCDPEGGDGDIFLSIDEPESRPGAKLMRVHSHFFQCGTESFRSQDFEETDRYKAAEKYVQRAREYIAGLDDASRESLAREKSEVYRLAMATEIRPESALTILGLMVWGLLDAPQKLFQKHQRTDLLDETGYHLTPRIYNDPPDFVFEYALLEELCLGKASLSRVCLDPELKAELWCELEHRIISQNISSFDIKQVDVQNPSPCVVYLVQMRECVPPCAQIVQDPIPIGGDAVRTLKDACLVDPDLPVFAVGLEEMARLKRMEHLKRARRSLIAWPEEAFDVASDDCMPMQANCGAEVFINSRPEHGCWHIQYGRCVGLRSYEIDGGPELMVYASKLVDAYDRSTWLTAAEIAVINAATLTEYVDGAAPGA